MPRAHTRPLVAGALLLVAMLAGCAHDDGSGVAGKAAADLSAACGRVPPADRRPLLFSRAIDRPPVWRARLDLGGRVQIPGVASGHAFALSPHGCQVAFVSTPLDGRADVLVVADADGSHRRRVGENFRTPAWSPDGTRLAVVINRPSRLGGPIGVVAAAGGTPCTGRRRPRCAVTPPDLEGETPSWSPDSMSLVFAGARVPRPGRDAQTDLYAIKADGSGLRRLTRTRGTWEAEPVWSPDGRLIAYSSGWRFGLWVMRANGQGRRRITRGEDGWPTFSPDGRFIYFLSYLPLRKDGTAGEPGLYRIAVSGGRPQLLLRGEWSNLSLTPRWP